jgi:hypothetical protein
MSTVANDDQTRQIFLSLAESVEDGKSLPTEILIAYSEHPEDAIRRLAIEAIGYENDPAGVRPCCGQRRTRTSRSGC